MKLTSQMATSSRERGAALIEFAFVLPVLLLIIAGILYYGFAFVLVSAAQDAARSGAEAAIAVSPLQPDKDAYKSVVRDAVDKSVKNALSWLPGRGEDLVPPPDISFGESHSSSKNCNDGGENSISVRVKITPNKGKYSLLPTFSIGGYQIPPGLDSDDGEPAVTASACAQL